MTKEEVKERYTMHNVLDMYGIKIKRGNLVHCPFHQGDREPSMKIYPKDFHCFGCGANGDIFTFVQMMDNLTFKEAFEFLGGTYEQTKEGHYKAALKAYRANKMRETNKRQADKLKALKTKNNELITMYRLFLSVTIPMSDLWCEVYNKLQYQLYVHEILNDLR